jgi:pteridine reductase
MPKCVLVTGAAKRIGAEIARFLHAAGYSVIIHYRSSAAFADLLNDELNDLRPKSAHVLQADLSRVDLFQDFAETARAAFGRIDALVNNASAFYPTPLDRVTESQWDDLIGSNLKVPFFLSCAFAPELEGRRGSIVNISDIHALRPLKGFSVYSISKAGMIAMTQSLARELAPSVRVNGIAPGAILWPENQTSDTDREAILEKIALKRTGTPKDIAGTVLFFLENEYVTGQVLPIDGGRSLYS